LAHEHRANGDNAEVAAAQSAHLAEYIGLWNLFDDQPVTQALLVEETGLVMAFCRCAGQPTLHRLCCAGVVRPPADR